MSLRGRKNDALAYLRRVVERAPDAPFLAKLATDADLASLHGDPEFQKMVATQKARRSGKGLAPPVLETAKK